MVTLLKERFGFLTLQATAGLWFFVPDTGVDLLVLKDTFLNSRGCGLLAKAQATARVDVPTPGV